MPRIIIIAVSMTVLLAMLITSNANAGTINAFVDGRANLYNYSWGHPFGATEPGLDPLAVTHTFRPGDILNISATDCAIDAGTSCTGPDGMSFIFRDLPAYSLIGVWSTEQSLISPVDGGPNPAFFIGSAASLTAPDAASFIYLFLANNDGLFTDNGAGYNVVIETTTAPVPEPSTIVLTLAGLMGITCFRSRKQEIRN